MANPPRRRLWLLLLALLIAGAAGAFLFRQHASTLESNYFRWGGDAAGGAPFIYGPAEQRVGFEVELVDYLCQRLDRRPEFVQADWNALPDTLRRGDIDVALNGVEFLPDREKEFASTIPYFVYTLRLIVRRGDATIRGWGDLRARPGRAKKRVGVLSGTVAERYLHAEFGQDIVVVPTREVDETFQLVEGGERLDATVQDSPAAAYYVEGGQLPKLEVVGEAVAPGYYVILLRKQDADLREKLNAGLREALRSGELERIFRKYNLWSPEQEELKALAVGPWPPPDDQTPETPGGKVSLVGLTRQLLHAAGLTIALACSAMPLAILLGIAIAVGRLYGPWPVRAVLGFYVEVLRGTPLLLQMFVLFYLVPEAARWTGSETLVALTTLPSFAVGVLGLALNYSAYEAEIYRAGLLAIPRGQMEAALALGMTRAAAIRRVVLPQAIRLVVPPVTNDFIALFKDTSICSMILITELTALYYQNKWNRDVALQLALVVAILYFAMSYPLSLLARRLERRQQSVHG